MIGLIILGILLVFLAVLVIRALCFNPKPQPKLDAEPIDFDKDAAVSALQKLVQCKTISNVNPALEDDAEFEKLIDLLVKNPRERFGIPCGNDFTVWDLEALDVVDPADFLSLGKATPFEGWQIQGKCVATVCDGKVVYKA